MKTEAGWKLCTRKPSAAPAVIAARMPASSRPRSKAMTAKAAAEIAHTPAARPSMPSDRFTTFITATRPSSVSTSPTPPKATGPRKGSVMFSTLTPDSTSTSAASTWPASLTAGESSRQSSIAPTAVISAAPARMPLRRRRERQEQQRGHQHRGEDGEAAQERGGLARQPARLQRVDRADAPRQPRHGRCEQRGDDECGEEAEQGIVLHARSEGSQGPRRAAPRAAAGRGGRAAGRTVPPRIRPRPARRGARTAGSGRRSWRRARPGRRGRPRTRAAAPRR